MIGGVVLESWSNLMLNLNLNINECIKCYQNRQIWENQRNLSTSAKNREKILEFVEEFPCLLLSQNSISVGFGNVHTILACKYARMVEERYRHMAKRTNESGQY